MPTGILLHFSTHLAWPRPAPSIRDVVSRPVASTIAQSVRAYAAIGQIQYDPQVVGKTGPTAPDFVYREQTSSAITIPINAQTTAQMRLASPGFIPSAGPNVTEQCYGTRRSIKNNCWITRGVPPGGRLVPFVRRLSL